MPEDRQKNANFHTSDSTSHSGVDTTPLKPRKIVLIAAAFAGIVVVALGIVALTNFITSPFVYSQDALDEIATALENDRNYAIYDPNIEWRGLRRAHVNRLSEAPDVIAFGGSRWQEANGDLFPNQAFVNAHVHSDYAEDMLAISELLVRNDVAPKLLILSLRYVTFEPIADRTHEGWKNLIPEYRAMASRLGVDDEYGWFETAPLSKWNSLFSVGDMMRRLERSWSTVGATGPTDADVLPDRDIVLSDGSLRWSEEHAALYTPSYARADAMKRAERNRDRALDVDLRLVTAFEKLLAFWRDRDVRVVLAQTPFHPAFYDAMRGRQFGDRLDWVEDLARRFSTDYGVQVIGSFDAKRVGCPEDEFIDWHHGTPACLQRVIDQMDE